MAIFQGTHFGPNFELRVWGGDRSGVKFRQKNFEMLLYFPKKIGPTPKVVRNREFAQVPLFLSVHGTISLILII